MRHLIGSRRTWGRLTLAVLLTVTVIAAPATAKGPVFIQPTCPPTGAENGAVLSGSQLRTACVPRRGHGGTGSELALVAAGAALVVLIVAGGLHLATRRAEPLGTPRMSS
jgi:hypothetical protein